MDTTEEKVRKLLASRKAIVLDMKLARLLRHDDLRDLFQDVHDWGYTRDFTFRDYQCNGSVQRYLRLWLREMYLE